jgi:DNA-binding transcriptional ArsR family regulator/ubiquinone/menaquinone biosynthesis C-methylase UbiE
MSVVEISQSCLIDEQNLPVLTDIIDVETPQTPLANLLKAAGDPLRLDILRVLAQDSFGVLELSQIFSMKQSGMSHHLKVLTTAGLLSSRREGNSIFYRRAHLAPTNGLVNLQQELFSVLDVQPIAKQWATQIDVIQQERSRAAQNFFIDNADKFRAQQDLIASYPIYADQVAQLLFNTNLKTRGLALEVGPGEGEFLPVLAKHFNQVIALDTATTMLEKSKQLAAQKNLRNIEFIHGDTRSLPEHKVLADCIIMNMVLHHTASPADIFQDLSHSLAPGGALLICDLCRHEQTWARDACGDLWQGFDPQDFSRFAQAAGLSEGQSIYFALRNGFQIQLRQFFKPAAF